MGYTLDAQGRTIHYRTLLVCGGGEFQPDGSLWYVHLTDEKWNASCGATTDYKWKIAASTKVDNWGALLCPGCRKLMDAELREDARNYKNRLYTKAPGQRPGATVTKVRMEPLDPEKVS